MCASALTCGLGRSSPRSVAIALAKARSCRAHILPAYSRRAGLSMTSCRKRRWPDSFIASVTAALFPSVKACSAASSGTAWSRARTAATRASSWSAARSKNSASLLGKCS
jgi:hypothetical protein